MASPRNSPASGGRLQITQLRSPIGSLQRQRATLRGLGLKRIRHTVTQPDRPEIRGMIAKVAHLVEVVAVASGEVVSAPPSKAETKLPSSKLSPVEQHAAGVGAASRPERPAAPGAPASPPAGGPEDSPDTGPSGETSTSSPPGSAHPAVGSTEEETS